METLKIFDSKTPIKDIPFGWRLACMSEAAVNLDPVKEILRKRKIRYANLCDGNVNEDGMFEDKRAATEYYLFIPIVEVEKGHGSDAKGDKKGKGNDKGQTKKGDEKGKRKDKGSGQNRNIC